MAAKDQIISVDQIEKARRGRTASFDEEMLDEFRNLEDNQAIVLSKTFGPVEQSKRPSVRYQIEKHWKKARRDGLMINFNSDGVPQVSAK